MRTAKESRDIAEGAITGIRRHTWAVIEKAIHKAGDEGLFRVFVFIRYETLVDMRDKLAVLGYATNETGKANDVGMREIEIEWY